MKAAWEDLGTEYEASSSVIIGDADCTVHQDLCSTYGVKGYPTIKYFTSETASDGDAYSGGRDLESLKKFVSDKLEVKCDVNEPSGCTEKETKFIETFKAKSEDDVQKQIDRLTKMAGGKMKAELKQWLSQRLNILKQLQKQE
jgi:outer membrane cobalamin receptor|mmetsp:Transcript_27841/g.39304  ORF Transcript_27841/g.39304 Transcript_27841/m.39304 type:complete len:143 (+) Transcript_27841:162-590(+)|eukprot:CAMPEP_0175105278 /NCGR_PEP_ID=MMETSP0086_2-20121207/10335_1 /TAXON_ID=136419 /ORGANISM="Unknown Unknown, Strain D1" /LENGTH=142 /DNA_ID=CAMNT_0016381045 /DNA_START=163 /DNA_END=591 /DNA_ORIENTATION=+